MGPHNVPGEKPQQAEEKPTDKLTSILPVTQKNAYKIKQKQYYNYMCNKR